MEAHLKIPVTPFRQKIAEERKQMVGKIGLMPHRQSKTDRQNIGFHIIFVIRKTVSMRIFLRQQTRINPIYIYFRQSHKSQYIVICKPPMKCIL